MERAVQLASKLQYKENARLRIAVFTWANESKKWAKDMIAKYGPNEAQRDEAGFRLLYILNHYCPALHHFCKKPNPQRFKGDIEGYNRAMQKHWMENTQAGLRDKNGVLIQEGVEYNSESLVAFLEEAEKYKNLQKEA